MHTDFHHFLGFKWRGLLFCYASLPFWYELKLSTLDDFFCGHDDPDLQGSNISYFVSGLSTWAFLHRIVNAFLLTRLLNIRVFIRYGQSFLVNTAKKVDDIMQRNDVLLLLLLLLNVSSMVRVC